ncbi:MAG: hypothetical protein IPN92_10005 [Chromatiaceae bacterium]|nr:hypothetical protein [Chromatiaceae bacterium]
MIYARLYETQEAAREAVAKLKKEGFPEETLFLVTPDSNHEEGSVENLATAIRAGFMEGYDAPVYAQGLESGRSLVMIRTGFGYGQLALNILGSFGPVDTDLLPRPRTWADGDKFTPLSAALGLPVLSCQPAPISELLGLEPLATGDMFHRSFGFGLLSNKATPLSSLFYLKTLAGNASPKQASFGLSLLTQQVTPKSSSFGLPLLSQKPAPLSSMFGLPLLTGDSGF